MTGEGSGGLGDCNYIFPVINWEWALGNPRLSGGREGKCCRLCLKLNLLPVLGSAPLMDGALGPAACKSQITYLGNANLMERESIIPGAWLVLTRGPGPWERNPLLISLWGHPQLLEKASEVGN